MAYLLTSSEAIPLRKKITSVGSQLEHDVRVEMQGQGLLCSIVESSGAFELVPGISDDLMLNGKALRRAAKLAPLDRIEWKKGVLIFAPHEESLLQAPQASAPRVDAIPLLLEVADQLRSGTPASDLYEKVLQECVRLSEAEGGLLLVESPRTQRWEILESVTNPALSIVPSRAEVFSQSVLKQVLVTREPVHVRNMIGSPLSSADSIIASRIFSLYCAPLLQGDRCLGVIYLYSKSPGRALAEERLPQLRAFLLIASLLLSSSEELEVARAENQRLRNKPSLGAPPIHSGSPAIQEALRKTARVAPSDLPVLIQGETGTGKELFAAEIHRLSRVTGPFIAVNCAAIPGGLLESILFGYERGAFTGADRAQEGKIAQANGGTLFLDEIGDLPLELQSKLLRVLQQQEVEPLGARRAIPVRVRWVSATHQDLERMVGEKRFREDLYYRLAGVPLRLPPLRERGEDLLELARDFLPEGVELSEEAERKLRAHAWPGNIRELKQALERAALLASGTTIEASDLELRGASARVEREPDFGGSLAQAQEKLTQRMIERALEQQGGNRAAAAAQLGISERTLYRLRSELAGQPDNSVSPSRDRGGYVF
jgi:transcriptional regulator with GAF, ATPase, and Fis domain